MLKRSPFDARTNTGAETTDCKCFDAISQQSVKQKTFVALYNARVSSVNTKGRGDQSMGAQSVCHSCVCHSLRLNLDLMKWVKAGEMTGVLVGATLPCGGWLVKGIIIQRVYVLGLNL